MVYRLLSLSPAVELSQRPAEREKDYTLVIIIYNKIEILAIVPYNQKTITKIWIPKKPLKSLLAKLENSSGPPTFRSKFGAMN